MKGPEKLFNGLDDSDTVTVTVGRLRELVRYHTSDPPEILSTVEAKAIIGWSHSYWRDKASRGLIEGAFQDGERWCLPFSSCKKYVATLQLNYQGRVLRGRSGPRGPRGPTKKASWAQTP